MLFGLVPKSRRPNPVEMAYITTRNNRFYVVAYDGVDPATGKERRRWHAAGRLRADAEAIANSLSKVASGPALGALDGMTLVEFLTDNWLNERQHRVRPTTAARYRWIIDPYITPTVGSYRLRSIRTEHLDDLYANLSAGGGRDGRALASKTVHEVHLIVASALRDAQRKGLVRDNVAAEAKRPSRQRRAHSGPETWTADELRTFLGSAASHRLYPALHLAATTGMRRGELAGLHWGDWNSTNHRLSINRSRQALHGRATEFATKTRTSRRCIDLDHLTEQLLNEWKRSQQRQGNPTGTRDPIFTNPAGGALHPETISQLFARIMRRSGLPPIRFHDLRHTHASLLVANGVPIKVVSERLGHAHPSFTIHTYQHLLPGMSATAARQFAELIAR